MSGGHAELEDTTIAPRRRALLIEPQNEPRLALEKALADQGLAVAAAPSLEAAMAKAGSGFDYVILGPGLEAGAIETCKRLRVSSTHALGLDKAFYVLIAQTLGEAELAALRSGVANDILVSPIQPEALAGRLAVLEARLVERDACERAWRSSGSAPFELADVLVHVPDTILMLDPQGAILFNNRGGPLATPVAPVGRNVFDFAAPGGSDRLRGRINAALTTGEPQAYEVSALDRCFTVRLFPIRLCTDQARVILIVTDITQRKQMEEALRASEAHANAILEALPDLYFRISRGGVYLDFRAENEKDLYAPADRIVGARVHDLMPPEFSEALMVLIEKALATGAAQVFEYQLPMPQGPRQFEARLVVCAQDEVLAIVRDVTDRKQAEAQLWAADRMAALGTLAAGVAHEINNPLAYMLLNMRFVVKELGSMADADGGFGERAAMLKARLEDALDGVERVRRIVSDLKSFSRGDEDVLGPVDVHGPIEAALDLAANALGSRARVIRCYGDVPYVHGNDKRLGQLFLNLLVNAAQALPEKDADRNEIRVTTARDEGGRVLVEITDTGSGIAPAIVEHIFDPFFTTKTEGGGTGLGLWMCQRIALGVGGAITVKSELGVGTTFCVALRPAFAAGAEA